MGSDAAAVAGMRRRRRPGVRAGTRLAGAMLGLAVVAAAATAQERAEPPEGPPPPDARFPDASLSLPSAAISLGSAQVSAGRTEGVAPPSAPAAAPGTGVAPSPGPVAAPGAEGGIAAPPSGPTAAAPGAGVVPPPPGHAAAPEAGEGTAAAARTARRALRSARGGAEADAGPPDGPPPASAVFPTSGWSLPDARMSFADSHVATADTRLSAGAAALPAGAMSLREERGALRFTLGADVLFDFDRAELRREADPVLRRLVEEVAARVPGGSARYRVEGHTDWVGGDAYNQRLSERRAASVRDWLVRGGGVTPARVRTEGFGEARPVAPNARPDGSDDPEGRQRNRRVEVVVTPR
jgi:outer membrane protein OmpA-like peptidoglycan-associated protein